MISFDRLVIALPGGVPISGRRAADAWIPFHSWGTPFEGAVRRLRKENGIAALRVSPNLVIEISTRITEREHAETSTASSVTAHGQMCANSRRILRMLRSENFAKQL
jgi:hypothetical protein